MWKATAGFNVLCASKSVPPRSSTKTCDAKYSRNTGICYLSQVCREMNKEERRTKYKTKFLAIISHRKEIVWHQPDLCKRCILKEKYVCFNNSYNLFCVSSFSLIQATVLGRSKSELQMKNPFHYYYYNYLKRKSKQGASPLGNLASLQSMIRRYELVNSTLSVLSAATTLKKNMSKKYRFF